MPFRSSPGTFGPALRPGSSIPLFARDLRPASSTMSGYGGSSAARSSTPRQSLKLSWCGPSLRAGDKEVSLCLHKFKQLEAERSPVISSSETILPLGRLYVLREASATGGDAGRKAEGRQGNPSGDEEADGHTDLNRPIGRLWFPGFCGGEHARRQARQKAVIGRSRATVSGPASRPGLAGGKLT